MNLKQVLYQVSKQGIKLWAEDSELKINAPKGSLTAEIRDALLHNKSELVQLLQGPKSNNLTANSIPLVPVYRTDNCTPSYQQERLWSVAQLMPGQGTLNISKSVRIQGVINIPVLQTSWNQIVSRHEILRTSFALVEGSLLQTVLPHLEVTISVEDYPGLSTAEIAAVIEENFIQESRNYFDLSQAPLFDLKLLRFSDTDGVLFLIFHHIITDGLSINLLIQELLSLYDTSLDKKQSPLTELEIQYGDYAVWQRQWLQGEILEKGLNYWQKQLAGVSTLYPVPVDNFPLEPSFRSRQKTFEIPATTLSAIQKLSNQYSVTPVVILLAVFYVLIAQYSLKQDIVIGFPVSGRVNHKLQSAIGFFADLILLRGKLAENFTFKELLYKVKESTVEAYAHQHIPFNYVAELVEHQKSQQYRNLFQILFDYIDLGENTKNYSNFTSTTIAGQLPTDIDLFFALVKLNQELKGLLTYNANLFEEDTITALIDSYSLILEQCLNSPETKVNELELSARLKQHQVEIHSKPRTRNLVETALKSLPEVEECATLTKDNQLVAYLVISGNFSEEKIHSYLQSYLSPELLPSAYVPVSALPRTELGAVDEATLNSLETIDSDLIARWEEKLKSHPDIEQVAVVTEYHPAPALIPVSRETWGREDAGTRGRGDAETGRIEVPPEISFVEKVSSPSNSPCQVDQIAASTEFDSWADLLPGTDNPAILGTDNRKPLTHRTLKEFVQSPPDNASLSHLGIKITQRVCAAMPNGPEAAVAFLSLAQQCVFAPISLSLTEKQVLFELEDLSAVALVLQRGEANNSSNAKLKACAESLGVRVIELIPDTEVCGVFTLEEVTASQEAGGRRQEAEGRRQRAEGRGQEAKGKRQEAGGRRQELRIKGEENKPTREHVALVLHTSGTTRKPKTVPLTHGNLTAGALTISKTIALTPEDTCINIMPLFHIHGLSVNILASLLAGASVLCTPGLYATENGVADFFRWLQPSAGGNKRKVTWYSAVPTMHQAILEYAEHAIAQTGATPNHSLRLIRNCSAALLPAIAERMARAFNCEILPTYAMTESMPICSPQLGQGLAKHGSVGPAAGPQLIIGEVTENEQGKPILKVLPPYAEGEVMVRGACVTAGYELRDWMDYNPNEEAFIEGWLRTGDKGYLDEDGYVYLVGRFKEIINRAGEKISPMLVEDVLQRHPGVGQVVVFAAPHTSLGEVVGAAIVPVEGKRQKAEGRRQKAESRGQRAEGRGQKAEGRGQRAEGRGQKAEGSSAKPLPQAGQKAEGKEEGCKVEGHDMTKQSRPSLAALRQFALKQKELELQWLPECLVWMSAIPKGMTGKPARIGLAKRLGLPTIPGNGTATPRTFIATEEADGKYSLETIDYSPAQRENGKGGCQSLQQLAAYFTSKTKDLPISQLQSLEVCNRFGTLSHILPTAFVQLDALPLTPDGKIDRKKLQEPDKSTGYQAVPSANETQRKIAAIWREVLQLEEVGIDDNFFELGGKSILLIQVYSKLQEVFADLNLKVVDLLAHPTVNSLSQLITGDGLAEPSQKLPTKQPKKHQENQDIAIIGMAGRFPGAKNLEEFWENLKNGVESISQLSDQQLAKSGIGTDLLNNPNYVKVHGLLSDIDLFDADFFNYSPREAKEIDPQQRLFLECAWEAIESSGYNPQTYQGSVGVYAGGGMPTYLMSHLGNQGFILLNHRSFEQMIGNDKDYLATRTAYKLNLTGPAINVQTACSTSLVTVHLACQSLLNGECDMALAGGVSIQVPQEVGYLYQEGMIASPDGHCRAFDAKARGTILGSGVGVVVLKPLQQALADGDSIQAVIKGSAINNDGSLKLGYTAPSVAGQIGVISKAQAVAGINPETIHYIEAHGTGTELGDPIEIEALTKTFAEHTQQKQFCAIGSVKTNVGHLNTAAGVASLIKTVLALKHGLIPPSLHFEQPSPQIDFANSPFYVNTSLSEWSSNGTPRRAAVSSFGIGGTNAHLVLEEAPKNGEWRMENGELSPCLRVSSKDYLERSRLILTLSGKTKKALEDLVSRYHHHLERNPKLDLADVCYTANTGRVHFNHRLAVVASSTADLVEKLHQFLREHQVAGIFSGELVLNTTPKKVAFLFTGQGSQYVNMAKRLYKQAPVFRQALEQCNQILLSTETFQEKSLLEILYPPDNDAYSSSLLNQTAYTQPALFAIEYALFKLWQSWDIKPDVVMGHSVGEYVAATVAGIFSLEDGLKLIAARGRFMQQLPAGGEMVSVMASEATVKKLIETYLDKVAIAAINGPESTVISGESETVKAIATQLQAEGIKTKQLQVSHAFHSPLMEPMLAEFAAVANQLTYHPPQIPIISNVTGTIVDKSITTAQYWVNHLRQPVRFADSMTTLHQEGAELFLEIGPKPILLGMGRQCLPEEVGVWLPSLRPGVDEWQQMLSSLGQLYVQGFPVNWLGFDQDYPRQKVVLPTYPFQRQRYWLEKENKTHKSRLLSSKGNSHPLLGERLYSALQQQQIQFESQLSVSEPTYLTHYRVWGQVVFPAAGYLEMLLAGGVTLLKSPTLMLEDVSMQRGLVLEQDQFKVIQTFFTPLAKGSYQFQIFSRHQDDGEKQPSWTLHVEGKLLHQGHGDTETRRRGDEGTGRREISPHISFTHSELTIENLEAWKLACPQQIPLKDHYQKLRDRGIDYGSSFQGIQQLWRGENQAIGEIKLPEELVAEFTDYQLHPALLDAGMQVIAAAIEEEDNHNTYVPVFVERFKIYRRPDTSLWAIGSIAKLTNGKGDSFSGEITLLSSQGETIATMEGLQLKPVTREALLGSDTVHEVEWKVQPRFGKRLPSEHLLNLAAIDLKLHPLVSQLVSEFDLKNYSQLLSQVETLSVDYIVQTFANMNCFFPEGECFSSESLAQQLEIVLPQQPLFNRLLEILAEVGILQGTTGHWQVIKTPQQTNPQLKNQTLQTQYSQGQPELNLLDRCGSQLSAVLQGTADPLQVVFPEGDLTASTQIYEKSSEAQVMNTLVQQAIATALEKLPQDRGVRLLEIGAGTGGTTSSILPHLNPHQTEYVFTDIGSLFTSKAQEKFRDYPFVRYEQLDIEQDPTTQGFEEHQYDLIVAANVIHATTDLRQTLENVQQLLAPGGILVLLEITTRIYWADLFAGLLEGWWRFQDFDLRPNHPLLKNAQWQQLLKESNFPEVVVFPGTQSTHQELFQQSVIVAQTAATTLTPALSEPKNWLILADRQGVGENLATQLRSQGEICVLVKLGQEYQQLTPEDFTINPEQPEDFQQAIAQLVTQSTSWHGVVQCCGHDFTGEETSASETGYGSTLLLVQALVKAELSPLPCLWLVTQGAQPLDSHPVESGVSQSSLGMVKTISSEHPEVRCMAIDLDPQQTVEEQARMLMAEIWSESQEDEVAFRQGIRYVAQLIDSHQTKSTLTVQQYQFLQQIKTASISERQNLLRDYLQSEIVQVLGMNHEQVDLQKPLNDMGVDSLMALELRSRIKTHLEVELKVSKFVEGVSISDLATEVNEQLEQIETNQENNLENEEQINSAEGNNIDWLEGEL